MGKDVICWWSGGVTSAVACQLAMDFFGKERCRVIMIDTGNEHEDTYRFKGDCEKWYGMPIETISGLGDKYKSIEDVWLKHLSLNTANGAICSSVLKKLVRIDWQKKNSFSFQIFGFEFEKKEFNRALSLKINYPGAKSLFPLMMMGYDKRRCIEEIGRAGIEIPVAYKLGFRNNNCFKTGCVQGGIGYWQKIRTDFVEKFDAMAEIEHLITNLKGIPVTMLKSQSKADVDNRLVFLKKHPSYPDVKCLLDMPVCEVEPLFECNGYCGINDLLDEKSATYNEINFEI